MKIVRARSMGFCFGVRDALAMAEDIVDPSAVRIHGDLVHNEEVRRSLLARGFEIDRRETPARSGSNESLLITAHGISDRERARHETAGTELIDSTCPLVRRAHDTALRLHDAGYFVVIVGKPGHVEVEGLTGDLKRFAVVESPDRIPVLSATRIACMSQTTTPSPLFSAVAKEIDRLHPDAEVLIADTICAPTKERQEALSDLLLECDFILVVGGEHSNNSRRLAERARAAGIDSERVAGPEEIDPAWLFGRKSVGLTAGTSTPDESIEAVFQRLRELSAGC